MIGGRGERGRLARIGAEVFRLRLRRAVRRCFGEAKGSVASHRFFLSCITGLLRGEAATEPQATEAPWQIGYLLLGEEERGL